MNTYDNEYKSKKPYEKKVKNHKFGNKESDDYFSEKTKKQKRRNNKYRDKMRYDEKYDGWN